MRDIAGVIGKANEIAAGGRPVIVAVRIDYSKKTAFTLGAVKTNFGRFPAEREAALPDPGRGAPRDRLVLQGCVAPLRLTAPRSALRFRPTQQEPGQGGTP